MNISQKFLSEKRWMESLCKRPEAVVQIALPLLPSKVSVGWGGVGWGGKDKGEIIYSDVAI